MSEFSELRIGGLSGLILRIFANCELSGLSRLILRILRIADWAD